MGTQSGTSGVLAAVAAQLARPEAGEWLMRVLPQAAQPFSRAAFAAAFAGVGRRFAVGQRERAAEDDARLRAAGLAVPAAWSLADLARGALLTAAMDALPSGEHVALARELFDKGDTQERVAVLRALSLLPEPARFAPLAVEACRSHVLDVLTAIACENPFPARELSEPAWNQLVMKVIFVGVPLPRVLGWQERNNAELARMARDFAAERRAAARVVPEDVLRIDPHA